MLQHLIQTPATWAIAAINVGWFLFAQAQGDTRLPETLVRFGALERSRIWRGESWRLVTACFMHVGWMHLFWNTYAMFGWNKYVEQELGSIRFALAYLITGIGASAVSVMGHRAISAGASGAGFGMIGVILILSYRHLGSWSEFFADPSVLSNLRSTGIWFLLGVFLLPMDNYAHAGGFVFGLLAGYAMTPFADEEKMRIPLLTTLIVVWIAVVLASLRPRFARNPGDDAPPR